MAEHRCSVEAYCAADDEEWDSFVERSVNGTLMHTRRYIGYHRDRFADRSLMVRDAKGSLVAVIPAALDPEDPTVVVSHPGLTYGGLVHCGLTGAKTLTILPEVLQTWHRQGATNLLYRAIPRFYHAAPADQDLYVLRRLGAVTYRTDLSTTVDLGASPMLSIKRQQRVKKAERAGLRVEAGAELVGVASEIITESLQRRHGAAPTHCKPELADICRRCPKEIRVDVAFENDTAVATVISFLTPMCWHTQYIASSPRGFMVRANDLILARLLNEARESGRRWFDFGISTERSGQVLNEGLESYKADFGGGGALHEFLQVKL